MANSKSLVGLIRTKSEVTAEVKTATEVVVGFADVVGLKVDSI